MTRRSTLIACSLAYSFSSVVVAAPNKALPTVTVTGKAIHDALTEQPVSVGRSALPALDTPISIHAVSPETLQDQQPSSLIDALRNVSGIQPSFFIGGAFDRFVVRGFTQSSSTYRNGVQQPFSRFHLANSERVEVLKGPAALEYGMSDPGGIINIVTRKPSSERALHLEQTASSYDDYRTTLGATGALDGANRLLARVDASYYKANGFRELTNTEESFITPSFSWLATDDTTINLSYEYDHVRRLYDGGVPAIGDTILDVPRDRTYNQAGLGDEIHNRLVDLNVEHRFNTQWKLAAGYSDYSTKTDYRSMYAYNGNLQPGENTAERYAWFGPEDFTTRAWWSHVSGEWRNGAVQHHVMVGVQSWSLDGKAAASETYLDTINLYTYRYPQSHIDFSAIDEAPKDGFTSDQQDKSTGIFVQDQMVIAERLIVQLGARYDRIDRELDTAYYSPVEHSERDDSAVSPRAALLYKLTPQISTYVGYSESFGPAFNFEPSALYKPETAKQYEIGVKTNLADDSLTATVALFDLTKQNLPTPDPNNPNFTVAIGEANSQGIEVDLQSALTRQLSLQANYSYLETEITRDYDGNKGNRLPSAPRHQGAVWLRYAFDQQLQGLSLGAGAFAASSRYGDVANSYSDDSYLRWDAFAAYRFNVNDTTVNTQLNVINLTDEEYYSMRSRWTNMPEEPRTVVASVAVEF